MKGWFISGTDTGVGKTVLSALLLAEMRHRKRRAAYLKPVQTGCGPLQTADGTIVRSAPDLEYVLAVAEWHPPVAETLQLCPFRFELAASPHLAARRENWELRLKDVAAAVEAAAANYDLVLVEGAGGLLVPLNRRETMADLIQALGLPVLLAARAGLGTINHTLLSLEALRSRRLAVSGVVLLESRPQTPGPIEKDNPQILADFSPGTPIITVPYCAAFGQTPPPPYGRLPAEVTAAVESICEQCLRP